MEEWRTCYKSNLDRPTFFNVEVGVTCGILGKIPKAFTKSELMCIAFKARDFGEYA